MYQKKYLELTPANEADNTADRERILNALKYDYENLDITYDVLRTINPLCINSSWRITTTLQYTTKGWDIIRIESGDTSKNCYALAVDYGSTSVTMELINTIDKSIIASDTITNPQTVYGDEILSRIFYTKDNADHLNEIKEKTVDGLKELMDNIEKKSGIHKREYMGMVISANTTMVHFLLGLFPFGIFQSPYAPVATSFGYIRAKDLGLDLLGNIFLSPAAANYLGGDIISGLLCTDIEHNSELCIFLDIGTNGELVIGNKDFMIAGAGAAGPAFEGGISKYGMRADKGAVNHVRIENDNLITNTIDNAKPLGICGSGIVELIAQMFLNGWVDFRGTLKSGVNDRIIETTDENKTQLAVCYAWANQSKQGENLLFTQSDIYSFIQTKAAAHTMVASLLEYSGIGIDQIDKFYLSGAFGTYADLEAAITIGLYPDLAREKFIPLGNSSLKGSQMLLCDYTQIYRLDLFTEKINYVQFSEVSSFVENMRAAEFLPHTQTDKYPSVMKKLEEHLHK